jgi:hypothetical protein
VLGLALRCGNRNNRDVIIFAVCQDEPPLTHSQQTCHGVIDQGAF